MAEVAVHLNFLPKRECFGVQRTKTALAAQSLAAQLWGNS